MKRNFSVIFDMDGTLLDTQRICIPAWDYAGGLQGFKNMGSHIPSVCGMNEKGWNDYVLNNFEGINLESFKVEVRKYIADNLVVRFKDGAKELLEFLKENDIETGLASGSTHRSINHHLSAVDAHKYFEVTVGNDDVVNGKPAPDIFLLTAEKMGVAPEDCFVFEDSENGIRAAYAAGMRCIGVPDIVGFSNEVKDMLFAKLSSLSQAIDIFKEYI